MKNDVGIFVKDENLFNLLKSAGESTPYLFHLNPDQSFLDDTTALVVCDVPSLKNNLKLQEKKKEFLYVLSGMSDDENIKLIQEHKLHHVVGLNEQIFAPETISHLKKHLDKNMWGLKPYIDDSADIKVLSLSDSKFTNEMIADALAHFNFQDYFSSPLEYIQVMANELISNSLYKGPNKKRLEHGLETADRKSPVFLKGSDLVQVTLAMDARGVALSVQDSFGGLNYETLMANLQRSFNEKTAMEKKDGAGLGLYLTYLHSNQFIINFRENFRTEVICIIEQNRRYKNYKQRIRSFHFFQEVPGEKTKHS